MANKLLIYNAVMYGGSLSISPGSTGWVLIEGNKIADCGDGSPGFGAVSLDTPSVDGNGAMLLPGLIDSHVHFREPGLTHKGNIYSESRAAIAGGVTSFLEMPNTVPATTTAGAFVQKLDIAAATSAANYGFMLGAADGSLKALVELGSLRVPAMKLFMGTTTGGMAMPGDEELKQLLDYCAKWNIPVVVHAEDNDIIARNTADAVARYGSREDVPLSEHSSIRSAEACLSCTRKAIEMAETAGVRLHIAHVSTGAETEYLWHNPFAFRRITAETTPMYLDGEFCRPENRTWRHKINPAVKNEAEALRQALADGRIDTLATDHAPHLREEKQGGALTAASGAPSVQFALPVMLEYLEPELIVQKMAVNPAFIFGIERRGSIVPGNYADLVLVKKCEPYTITDADVISPCGWTPFAGRTVSHRVTDVWVNGVRTLENGNFTGRFGAEALVFNH